MILKEENSVIVLVARCVVRHDGKVTAHAQVNDQVSAIEKDVDEFSPAPDVADEAVADTPSKGRFRRRLDVARPV